MYIISKYKDYYDYLNGIYGIDEKVILDRRAGVTNIIITPVLGSHCTFKLAVCNTLYTALVDRDKNIYWGEEMKPFCTYNKSYGWVYRGDGKIWNGAKIQIEPQPTKVNQEENCPIVYVHGHRDQSRVHFPRLSDYRIASIYPAEEIYKDLYNWIVKQSEPVVTDTRKDIEKVVSHGFDKITSFRNKK